MPRYVVLTVLALTLSPYHLRAYSSGPPDGFTGAPGEDTCVMCHASYGLNTGPGRLTIEGPASFEPNQTYPVVVTLQQTGQTRWGFEFSPLDQGTCTLTDPAHTQLSITGGRTYVKHTAAGTNAGGPGPVSWTFNWTAPTDSPSSITFYATGNAANNDGGTGGDYVYTATHSMGMVPVELLRFDATLEGGAVVLRWATLTERDNAGFRVYRACDDRFQLISPRLIPGAGTSAVPHEYEMEDSAVRRGAEYSYRLTDVTSRGHETVCGRTSIIVPAAGRRVEVRPSVIRGHGALQIHTDISARIEVLDLSGRIIHDMSVGTIGADSHWDLRDEAGRRIRPGTYVCRATHGSETDMTPFVVLE